MIAKLMGGARVKVVGVLLLAVVSMSLGVVTFNTQQANADMCSINGRDCYYGYFTGAYDGGPGTLRNNVISAPALLNVNNAEQLIANIGSHMACSGGTLVNAGAQNATGSAFIILTMLGYAPGTSKNVACQQFGTWADLVRQWAPHTNYNVFYNFGGLNTRSSNTDVAYYPSAQTSAWSIIFYDQNTGAPLYAIKKDCANPVGHLQALPRSYTLTPRVHEVNPDDVVESGTRMSVSTRVDNVGDVASQNTQWEITQINANPGTLAPHENAGPTVSPEAPCQSGGGAPAGDYFRSGTASCRNVERSTGVFPLGAPSSLQPYVDNIDIGDVPVGTKVCFTFSVQPRSNADGAWAHAQPVCRVVGKKPKVQILGGDLAVRGQIDTSISSKNVGGSQQAFGSWVEYGAFSVGVNTRFASASGLNGQTNSNQAAWSNYTFANRNDSGTAAYGEYASSAGFRPLPNVAAYFSTLSNKQPVVGNPVDISSLAFDNGSAVVVRTAGDLTINRSNIPANRSVVILATGTVTIDDAITYENGPFTSARQIPQVVIIAENIRVKDSVSQVDAWLIANNTVDTCYNLTGNPTSGKCATLLEINGPVIASHLLLKRTAGSGTGAQSGDPAERINLRPDAFLWASLQARGSNKAQTVYSTELPPRF